MSRAIAGTYAPQGPHAGDAHPLPRQAQPLASITQPRLLQNGSSEEKS